MHTGSFTIHILVDHRKPKEKRGFHFHRQLDRAVDAPGLENEAGWHMRYNAHVHVHLQVSRLNMGRFNMLRSSKRVLSH